MRCVRLAAWRGPARGPRRATSRRAGAGRTWKRTRADRYMFGWQANRQLEWPSRRCPPVMTT
eukprot:1933242-Alexandrium_andersonii.AAC.1